MVERNIAFGSLWQFDKAMEHGPFIDDTFQKWHLSTNLPACRCHIAEIHQPTGAKLGMSKMQCVSAFIFEWGMPKSSRNRPNLSIESYGYLWFWGSPILRNSHPKLYTSLPGIIGIGHPARPAHRKAISYHLYIYIYIYIHLSSLIHSTPGHNLQHTAPSRAL